MTGPVALVGSGEYLPVMLEVERELLAGRPPRFVQVPTAAALEGAEVLARWVDLGRAQAARLGVQAVPLLAVDAASANDPELAAEVAGAGLIYLSGGSPPHVARTLRGSRVWAAIEAAWRAGAALAGCSAGAMALGAEVSDPRSPGATPTPALGVVPGIRVVPHFDRVVRSWPAILDAVLATAGPETAVLGIDEDTALVGGPSVWRVAGRGAVWEVRPDGRTPHPAGSELQLAASWT